MAGKTIAQHRQNILASLARGYPAFGTSGVRGGVRWMSAAESLVGEGACRIVPATLKLSDLFACVPIGTRLDLGTMKIVALEEEPVHGVGHMQGRGAA